MTEAKPKSLWAESDPRLSIVGNCAESDVPEVIQICADRLAQNQRPPVWVAIVHDPACNILSDPTVELRDHDCQPLVVTWGGFEPISQTREPRF